MRLIALDDREARIWGLGDCCWGVLLVPLAAQCRTWCTVWRLFVELFYFVLRNLSYWCILYIICILWLTFKSRNWQIFCPWYKISEKYFSSTVLDIHVSSCIEISQVRIHLMWYYTIFNSFSCRSDICNNI